MKNITEVTANELLKGIVDRTIREALKLQKAANVEYAKQKALEEAGQPYNYTVKHEIKEGARALCQVLWQVFGGYPFKHITTIEKMAAENPGTYYGSDGQDYVKLYIESFE